MIATTLNTDKLRSASQSSFFDIPPELQGREQWLVWRLGPVRDDGKAKKVPFDAVTDRMADPTSRTNWHPFNDAVCAVETRGYDGVGIGLAGDGLVGVDLDGCRDDRGALDPWAEECVVHLRTYTEVSPSGHGLRLFATGGLPEGGRRRGGFELYDSKRYLTVTGQRLPGTPGTVEHRPDELAALWRRYIAPHQIAQDRVGQSIISNGGLADDELLRRAMNAKNGSNFTRLWIGNTSGYASTSETDMALVSMLAFWTGPDVGRIISLFLASGLGARAKTQRKDYLPRTIGKVLKTKNTYYSQGKNTPQCVSNMCASLSETRQGANKPWRGKNTREVDAERLTNVILVSLPDGSFRNQQELRLERLRLLCRHLWAANDSTAILLPCRWVCERIGVRDKAGRTGSRLIGKLIALGELVRVHVEDDERQQRHKDRKADEYLLAGSLLASVGGRVAA